MGTLREWFGVSDRRRARDAAQDVPLDEFMYRAPGGGGSYVDPRSGGAMSDLGDLGYVRNLLSSQVRSNLLYDESIPYYLRNAGYSGMAQLGAPDYIGNVAAPQFGSLNLPQQPYLDLQFDVGDPSIGQIGLGRFGTPGVSVRSPELAALNLPNVDIPSARIGNPNIRQVYGPSLQDPRLDVRNPNIGPLNLPQIPGRDLRLPGDPSLSTLTAGRFGDPGRATFDRDLEARLRGAATGQLGIAGADPFALGSDRLRMLREQAAPFEQRAFTRLQDNLFNTGRLGTTGGGIQMEAFARGLSQADLDRQIAAGDFGRALQADATGRLQAFTGERRATRGLEEALNQGEFGRVLQGFGANLDATFGEFDRNQAAQLQGFRAALDRAGLQSQFDINRGQLGLQGAGLQLDRASKLAELGLSADQIRSQLGLEKAIQFGRLGLAGEELGLNRDARLAELGLTADQARSSLDLSAAELAGRLGMQGAELGLDRARSLAELGLNADQIRSALGIQAADVSGRQNLQREELILDRASRLAELGLSADQIRSQLGLDRTGLLGQIGLDRGRLALDAAGLESDRALRSSALGLDIARTREDARMQRAQARFDIADRLFGNEQQLDMTRFGRAFQALEGIGQLDAQALQQFSAALNAAIARSNAAAGQASQFVDLGSNPASNNIGQFIANIAQAFK